MQGVIRSGNGMQVTLTIRRAMPADTWAVHTLFGALYRFNSELDPCFALSDTWEDVLDEHLAHVQVTGHGLTLLAWHGSAPVGLLMMGVHTDSPLFRHRHWAELLALYVTPAARGSGLAQRLILLGRGWAHAHGYERVQLYVTAANEHAQRCYARAGFCKTQEIWRREIGPASVIPPADTTCEVAYAHGHDLLAPHAHHLHPDEDASSGGTGHDDTLG